LHKRPTKNGSEKWLSPHIQKRAAAIRAAPRTQPNPRTDPDCHRLSKKETTMTNLTETASKLGAKVSEAQGRAEDLSRAAGNKLDEVRSETAGAFHTAASSVRATARHGCEVIDGVATRTADKLDAAGSYVEDHDLRGLFGSFRQVVRRHPAGSLMAATAIGFFAGSALRRLTHSCTNEPVNQHS
jgi:ElaB/YqjD/DUF883 family membrane-anchored ribosome-binding protein